VGAGYGIASPGIFRMPYPLQRGFTGGEVDPVAALIGNALGSFQGVRAGRQAEADRQDALQRQAQQEKDQANWRDLQTGIGLTNAGLTNVAPAPTAPTTPTGFTPSGPAMTGPAALRAPEVSTVSQMQTPAPLVSVGGQSLWRAGPSAAEQKITEADTHAQLLHRKVGHALATQMFGHDVDDDTAEAIGTTPQSFTGLQKPGEEPHYFTDDKGNVTVSYGGKAGQPVPGVQGQTRAEPGAKITPQQTQQAEFGAGALAAWQQVERERTKNPQVETEVGKILASPAFVHAVPGFKSSADMVQLLQRAGASPEATRYLRAKWSFLDNVIRTRIPGSRMNGPLFAQVQNEFMPSLDPAGNSQIRGSELQAILSAQGQSGYDVNPDVWNKAVKRHGVGNIDLQNLLAGGSGYNPKHTDYPPGFRPQ